NRLMFQNIGLKKTGRRNLRFPMYSGTDVQNALSPAQKNSSTKSNMFGSGFADGKPVTIGCSYKGRVWSRDQGVIDKFTDWCAKIGAKLIDNGINTEHIIDSVMIPREIQILPEKQWLSIDWPDELYAR